MPGRSVEDNFQLRASGKGFLSDLRRFLQAHFPQIPAAIKSALSHGLPWQASHPLQPGTAREYLRLQAHASARFPFHLPQPAAAFESRRADPTDPLCNVQGSQILISVKGPARHDPHRLRKPQRSLQVSAIPENFRFCLPPLPKPVFQEKGLFPHIFPHGPDGSRNLHFLQSCTAIGQPVRNVADPFLQAEALQFYTIRKNPRSVSLTAAGDPSPPDPALGKCQVSHRFYPGQKMHVPQRLTAAECHIPQETQTLRERYLPDRGTAIEGLFPNLSNPFPKGYFLQCTTLFKRFTVYFCQLPPQFYPQKLYTVLKCPRSDPLQPLRKLYGLQQNTIPKRPGPDLPQAFRQQHPVDSLVSRKGILRNHSNPLRHRHPGLLPQIFQQNAAADPKVPQYLPLNQPHLLRRLRPLQASDPLQHILQISGHLNHLQRTAVFEGILMDAYRIPLEDNLFQVDTVPEGTASDFPQRPRKAHGTYSSFVKKAALPDCFDSLRDIHMF